MKEDIKNIARSLGIEEIGFSRNISMQFLKPLLKERLEKNLQSEFEENEIDKRLEANVILDNCKSMICAVFPYANGYHIPEQYATGNISVSSYGIDYHRFINERLELLAQKIQSIKKFNYKICVDTSPLLDRAICKSAGLGFIGKNNMLINDRYGTFVFLGYILTDLEIDDEYIDSKKNIGIKDISNKENYNDLDISKNLNLLHSTNECGKCNICVKKCPNHAILGDGTINSKRCVSYLTQTKGYINIEFRKAMGHQIYGCDVCQYYCPKNQHVINTSTENDYNELLVDLKYIMTMSNKEFKSRYGNIAGSWRGKTVWKRNAIIASANMKLDCMYDLIAKELYGDNEMLKIYALWALLEIDKEKAITLIEGIITNESETLQKEYQKILNYYD